MGPRLRVVSYSGVVTPETALTAVVELDRGPAGDAPGDAAGDAKLSLVGSVHRRVTSRLEYQRAVDEQRLPPARSTFSQAVADSASAERDTAAKGRRLTLRLSTDELGLADARKGVYPLTVGLEADGEVTDEVVTSAVFVSSRVAQPLRVALLVPVDHPPARLPGGRYVPERLARSLSSAGQPGRLTRALAEHPTFPATIAPSGLLLDQASDRADGFTVDGEPPVRRGPESRPAQEAAAFLQGLRRTVGARAELVATSHGPGDLPALVRAGLQGEVEKQLAAGRATLGSLLGAAPTRGVLWPPAGLTGAALETVSASTGLETIVVRERFLDLASDRSLPTSPSPVRRLAGAGGGDLTAVVPDPFLTDALGRESAPFGAAVAAHRIVAETAVAYFERPNSQQPRGLLLAPESPWRPPAGVTAALLEGLQVAPWASPVTLSSLVEKVEPASSQPELAYPASAPREELDPAYLAALGRARRDLGTLPEVLGGESELPARFDRLLLQASSLHYRSPRLVPEGRDLIERVSETTSRLYGSVTVAESLPFRLTTTEGRIAVPVRSNADVPLRVTVRLQPTPRYVFSDGGTKEVTLEPNGTTTVPFAARAAGSAGTYPVQVIVEAPSGALELAEGQVVVRSTALSVVAVGVTVGGAVFLFAWWLRGALRRRGQRPETARAS
jgi:hypothetical protein